MRTEHLPYYDFAHQYLDVGNVSGAEAMARCIVHDSSHYTLQYNMQSGLWLCFSCGARGGMKTLAAELGIANYREVEPDIGLVMEKLEALRKPKGTGQWILPEDTLDRYRFPTTYWRECPARKRPKDCIGEVGCSLHRWFTEETVTAFDLGYDPMKNAATIPARNIDGQLVGVIFRYLDPDIELRYRYPKGFNRASNMFGSWLVERDSSDRAVIVEGSVDAVSVWQAGIPALAQYGSSISPMQVRLLRRLGVGQVVLFYDNDRAGEKAVKYAQGIRQHRRRGKTTDEYDPSTDLRREFLVSAVNYTRSMKDDPGANTGRQIRRAVACAERLT